MVKRVNAQFGDLTTVLGREKDLNNFIDSINFATDNNKKNIFTNTQLHSKYNDLSGKLSDEDPTNDPQAKIDFLKEILVKDKKDGVYDLKEGGGSFFSGISQEEFDKIKTQYYALIEGLGSLANQENDLTNIYQQGAYQMPPSPNLIIQSLDANYSKPLEQASQTIGSLQTSANQNTSSTSVNNSKQESSGNLTLEQEIARAAIQSCKELGIKDPKEIQKIVAMCFAAVKVETNFRTGASVRNKDCDSAGCLQQRKSQGWTNPENTNIAIKEFVQALVKSGYQNKPFGKAIADVQKPREDLRWKYGPQQEFAENLAKKYVDA